MARPEETILLSKTEAAALVPGLTPGKLDQLRLDDAGGYTPFGSAGGPPYRTLSDRTVLYDELSLRRWLESAVDNRWVHGLPGDSGRPSSSREREYTYADASLRELRRRTYITPNQLLQLLPGLLSSQAAEHRASGTGPRFLRPTPTTIVYVAEEALWWSETTPGYSLRHERGYDGATRRPLLTPPVGVRRPLSPIEIARLRSSPTPQPAEDQVSSSRDPITSRPTAVDEATTKQPAALLTPDDVARILGVSVKTLYNWRSKSPKYGPAAITVGKYLRWKPETVQEWIDAQL